MRICIYRACNLGLIVSSHCKLVGVVALCFVSGLFTFLCAMNYYDFTHKMLFTASQHSRYQMFISLSWKYAQNKLFYYSVNLYQNKLIHIEMNVIISNDIDKSEFQGNLVLNPSSLCLQRATSLSRMLDVPSAIPHNCSPLPLCSPPPQTNDMTLD